MKDGKFDLKTFLNNIELYVAAVCFIILTIMLTGQVISRYVLKHAFTWMEEFATIMFVWMIYLGVSAAVTKRKHLRIDFVLDMVPFKVKRIMLIISNVIFAVFNVYISMIMADVIRLLGNSQTTMLRLPQALVYSVIPLGLLISVIRLIQDTLKLLKEDESNLGASKPSMDLDACERIYQEKMAARRKGGNN
jgi:TRAP-type C4-dicarboxylate transport system permease small subunit